MIVVIVGLNCLIALLGLWLCYKLRCAHQALRRITTALVTAEQVCHQTLQPAPDWIDHGQQATSQLRSNYQQLVFQAQQWQQVSRWLTLSYQILRFVRPAIARRRVGLKALR